MNIYWVSGPWRGRLGIGPRPRGNDWLEDDLVQWRRAGIDAIVSLLTRDEQQNLGLNNEATVAQDHGMTFISYPIPDLQVPASRQQFSIVLDTVAAALSSGKNVFIHCRQGIGRTGLVTACLLVKNEWTPEQAIEHLSNTRGLRVPETKEQRQWIQEFARRE